MTTVSRSVPSPIPWTRKRHVHKTITERRCLMHQRIVVYPPILRRSLPRTFHRQGQGSHWMERRSLQWAKTGTSGLMRMKVRGIRERGKGLPGRIRDFESISAGVFPYSRGNFDLACWSEVSGVFRAWTGSINETDSVSQKLSQSEAV